MSSALKLQSLPLFPLSTVLFPGGVPQERVFSLPAYAARHGAATLVSRVLAAIAPFDPAVVDLEL